MKRTLILFLTFLVWMPAVAQDDKNFQPDWWDALKLILGFGIIIIGFLKYIRRNENPKEYKKRALRGVI